MQKKPPIPDAFAHAFVANAVHTIVPIAGAHEWQAVRAELTSALDCAKAMFVEGAFLLTSLPDPIIIFLFTAKQWATQKWRNFIENACFAGHGNKPAYGEG